MKSTQKICSYPVVEKYSQNEFRQEALEHASECMNCLDQIIHLEHILPLSRNNQDFSADENHLALLVDQYLNHKLSAENISSEEMAQIGAISKIYRSFHSREARETPSYLFNIAMTRLEASRSEEVKATFMTGIIINIKEGIELINQSLEGLFMLPQAGEMVRVRSNGAPESTEKNHALNFYSEGEAGKKLVYFFVKESDNNVMMTIKLQNYSDKPSSIAIKQNGHILNTYPLSKDYAYFSRLTTGDYEVELQYNHGTRYTETIPLKIVAE